MKNAIIAVIVGIASFFIYTNYFKSMDWEEHLSEEGAYTVVFPGEIKKSTHDVYVDANSPIKAYVTDCSLKDWDVVFSVSYLDLPPLPAFSTEQALASSRDGSVRNMKGTLVRDQSIEVEGNPGREFVARAKGGGLTGNKAYFYRSRIFVADSRFYMVSATFPEKMDNSEEIQHFFDSFMLL